jgi:hypothetical protein
MRIKKVIILSLLLVLFLGLFYQLNKSYHFSRVSEVPQQITDHSLKVTPLANPNKSYTQLDELLYDSGVQSIGEAPIVLMGNIDGQDIYITDTVELIGYTSFTGDITKKNSTSETIEGIVQTQVTKPDLVFDVSETGTYFFMITLFVPEKIVIDSSNLVLHVNNKVIFVAEETIKRRSTQGGLYEWTAGFYIPEEDVDLSKPIIHSQLRINQQELTYTFIEDINQ